MCPPGLFRLPVMRYFVMSEELPERVQPKTSEWRKSFLSYLLQFLMTFLGVSLGFFADNLREQRSERRAEREYLMSLREDLKQDTAKLGFSIRRKSEKLLRLDTLVGLLSSADRQKHAGSVHFLLRYATIREPFYATTGTIRQLETAGGYRILQSRTLVSALNEYQSFCSKIDEIQNIRDDQSGYLKEAIAGVADGRVLMVIQNFNRNTQANYWLSLPESRAALLSESTDRIHELVYWLSNEKSLEGILQQLHRELKGKADVLLTDLTSEIGQ